MANNDQKNANVPPKMPILTTDDLLRQLRDGMMPHQQIAHSTTTPPATQGNVIELPVNPLAGNEPPEMALVTARLSAAARHTRTIEARKRKRPGQRRLCRIKGASKRNRAKGKQPVVVQPDSPIEYIPGTSDEEPRVLPRTRDPYQLTFHPQLTHKVERRQPYRTAKYSNVPPFTLTNEIQYCQEYLEEMRERHHITKEGVLRDLYRLTAVYSCSEYGNIDLHRRLHRIARSFFWRSELQRRCGLPTKLNQKCRMMLRWSVHVGCLTDPAEIRMYPCGLIDELWQVIRYVEAGLFVIREEAVLIIIIKIKK